ncbi:hypothetical protein PoB_002005300 [Plakobranchus ocellatus]|uniref:Uncharacterized protein n=1 Tax=Plakobranchus ocellatus TaxID=259542 RepID=A0AAV3ZGH0_9GAST|nr:hypothetical protein PoB_002005300 [Plakobranchus ocellatus]
MVELEQENANPNLGHPLVTTDCCDAPSGTVCQTETVETRSWTATELDAGPSSCCVDQASLHTPLDQLIDIVAELPNVNLVHPFGTINCQDATSGTVCQTKAVETRSWTATELDTGPSSCSTVQASLLSPLEPVVEIEADIPSLHLGHAPVTDKSPNAGPSSQSTKQYNDPTDVNNTSCSEADMSSSTVDFNDYHPEDTAEVSVRKRNKRPVPDTWTRTVQKTLRLEGRQYLNKNKELVPQRMMGVRCFSSFCRKADKRKCDTVMEDERKQMFEKFWKMGTWNERKTYVKGMVEKQQKKTFKTGLNSRIECVFSYFLEGTNSKVQVCKGLFASTLGISEKTINNWLREEVEKVPSKVRGAGSGPCKPISQEERTFLLEWLKEIPTVPSHYCRKQTSYQDKKFLFPGRTLWQLHSEYASHCEASSVRAVGRKYFTEVFHQLNMSFFIPRKDQCDVCVAAKHGNISKEQYQCHLLKKTNAQQMKARDKGLADDSISVWTMDLQSVLLSPKTQASALYYKTKLAVHNMTYFNLKSKEGFYYVYDETNGDLSGDMFASLHFNHFYRYLELNPGIKKLIIWSDGCGYQNKSHCIANSFLHLALERAVTIEQKYLVPGHTQMECDSMHSVIERRLHGDIFIPHDHVLAMQMARQVPFPYYVREVHFTDSFKLSVPYLKSVRPGKRAGDPTVSDVCCYQYNGSLCSVSYKLGWEDPWTTLPARLNNDRKDLIPMFDSRLKVNARKFADLQSMKSVMPAYAQHFYDTLPHEK